MSEALMGKMAAKRHREPADGASRCVEGLSVPEHCGDEPHGQARYSRESAPRLRRSRVAPRLLPSLGISRGRFFIRLNERSGRYEEEFTMLDIALIRKDPQTVAKALAKREYEVDFSGFLAWDAKRRQIITEV
jgi:hypothetical protein